MNDRQPKTIRINRGLDLPLSGKPDARIDDGAPVARVALLGRDYPGLKPAMLVEEGEMVALAQPLFSDKKNPAVLFTSPGSGRVAAIRRGERRAFISIEIELDGDDELRFPVSGLPDSGGDIEKLLLVSGLWTSLRTRPFSKTPLPGTSPAAIFVTAMDTNPLAADPALIIGQRQESFQTGLHALRLLTTGKVYLCCGEGVAIPSGAGITTVSFSGPHPSGLPGSHIHLLEPVDLQHQVWQVGYQDVIAIGSLLLTGRIMTERIVALSGPAVMRPRLLRTRLGADLSALAAGELSGGETRIISGSVLSGHAALGDLAFLGRYHVQVSAVPEDRERRFLDWLMPGFGKHSVKRLFAASLLPGSRPSFSTSNHGSLRAMVPIGAYEKVMPLDLKITWLLRSLLAGDLEMARNLGCLELDEEDLALCSYVCPGKIDYGHHLRQVLNRIEEEEI